MFFSQAKTPPTYFLIDSIKKVDWLRDELLKCSIMSADLESNWPTLRGVKVERDYPERICGVSFSWGRSALERPWKPGTAAYIPLAKADDSDYWGDKQDYVLSVLREILESPVKKVFQNGKFDISKFFLLHDIRVQNFYADTLLMHALLDEDRATSSHALKSDFDNDGKIIKLGMGDAYLGEASSFFKEELASALTYYDPHLRRYSKVPIHILYPYGCADADLTLSLYYVFYPMLQEEGMEWIFHNISMPLSHSIMVLELNGMPLSIERAKQVAEEQAAIMVEAQQEVWKSIGYEFNVGSNEQLGKILFEDLKLPGEKGDHNKWKVDVDALSELEHPLIEPILKYRRAQKIGGTYAEAALDLVKEISEDGKIGYVHTTYFLDSLTGRLKSNNPNLCNLPRKENGGNIVKSMWVCPEDYVFIFKDFSQIELRLATHLSQEPLWLSDFRTGVDVHASTAKKIFKLPCEIEEVEKLYKEKRTAAKICNFGTLFGMSPFALSKKLKMDYNEAEKFINEDYFGTLTTLKSWIDSTEDFAKQNGYIMNMFGRRRHMPEAMQVIPKSLPWPSDSDKPNCYRKGPYPEYLGIDVEDMYALTDLKIKQLIKLRGHSNPFTHCLSCPYIHSCLVNRTVKHVKSKVAHSLRQARNLPVQGGATDIVSLCLIEITKALKENKVDAFTVLDIHDELIVMARTSEVERVCRIMDYYMTEWIVDFTNFSIPLEVSTAISKCWGDK
jgi:DNA polymerase I-like protein with 3'-5' exonuclease and polymerase domains